MTVPKTLHAPIGTWCYSQSICPQSGIWRSESTLEIQILQRGDRMPANDQGWTLKSYWI